MAKPLVDIIIASLEDPEHDDDLELCLGTIQSFTEVAHRVILERSRESASRNRNRGLSKSTAPFVCFLDDDVWVTPGWCSELLRTMDSRPDVGMVGPKLKLESGHIFCFGMKHRPLAEFEPIGYGCEDDGSYQELMDPAAIPTTCLLLRREAMMAAGSFDTAYGTCQWEDLDYYMRLLSSGYRGVVSGGATVYHRHHFRSRHYEANRNLFIKRWESRLAGLLPAAPDRPRR